jgi:hypothetical protein
MRLQALSADLLHHALHRRVDRAEREVAGLQMGLEQMVAGARHRGHHAVGSDCHDAVGLRQADPGRAELAARPGQHRIDDVADETAVLRATGRKARRFVAAPHDRRRRPLRCRAPCSGRPPSCNRRSTAPWSRPPGRPRQWRTAPHCPGRRRPARRFHRPRSRWARRWGPSGSPVRPAADVRTGSTSRPSRARSWTPVPAGGRPRRR